jgi:uncharacterized membrane protein
MDPLIVVLRLIHVVSGAVWVGMVVFTTHFLMPALQEVGPDGGKVMGAIQRRGLMTVMPILALAALISGIWLYLHDAAGMHAEFARSPMGMAFGLGGVAAIAAYGIGIVVLRPSMLKAAALAQSLAQAGAADDRQTAMGEIQRLRDRATRASKAVMHLLLFAVAAMAVARYL